MIKEIVEILKNIEAILVFILMLNGLKFATLVIIAHQIEMWRKSKK